MKEDTYFMYTQSTREHALLEEGDRIVVKNAVYPHTPGKIVAFIPADSSHKPYTRDWLEISAYGFRVKKIKDYEDL